jgi:hypothetical protein
MFKNKFQTLCCRPLRIVSTDFRNASAVIMLLKFVAFDNARIESNTGYKYLSMHKKGQYC